MKLFQRVFGLIVVAAMWFSVRSVNAQAGIDLDLSAAYKFGEQITFTAGLKTPLQIQSAFILIQDTTQMILHKEPVLFNERGVSVYRFDTKQNILRPFTTVLWRYELTLADGTALQSQTQSILYDDDRFNWRLQELNGLRVHWYNSEDDLGVSALSAGQSGLQSIAGFFPPDLSSPVDIFIYANVSDLRGTLYGAEEAWVAGHADSAAGIVMVTIEAGLDQNIRMEQRIPHELMHVMLYRRVGAGYKNIPAWLREGMSTLAEVYPNPEYDRFLLDAASRDALIPILDLCDSFSPKSNSAFLAYAESRSFTKYLRGQYGVDGLLTLATIYANGVDCERGPERAFGVSLAKLERDWRVSRLGQNKVMSMLGDFSPYLVLLCLVVAVPLMGIVSAMRRKGASHEPETYAR